MGPIGLHMRDTSMLAGNCLFASRSHATARQSPASSGLSCCDAAADLCAPTTMHAVGMPVSLLAAMHAGVVLAEPPAAVQAAMHAGTIGAAPSPRVAAM